MIGIPPFSLTQCRPPSTVKLRPNSVPDEQQIRDSRDPAPRSTPGRAAAGRRATLLHVRPRSLLFITYGLKLPRWKSLSVTNTVLASCGEGKTSVTYVMSGHAGKLVDLAPGLPAVFGDLHQPVVGADEQHALFHRRFRHRRAGAELIGEGVLPDRVRAPQPAHHRDRVAIDLARQVGTHQLPGRAAVVAAHQAVGRDVQARVRVRAQDERNVPARAQLRILLAEARAYADARRPVFRSSRLQLMFCEHA